MLKSLPSVVTVHVGPTGTDRNCTGRIIPNQIGERGRSVIGLQDVHQHAFDLYLPDQGAEEEILEVLFRIQGTQCWQLHQDRHQPLFQVMPLLSLLLMVTGFVVIVIVILATADVLLASTRHQSAVLLFVVVPEATEYHVLNFGQMLILDVVLQDVVWNGEFIGVE